MIGNLFALFNGIIAILAVVWFIFIGLRHINKTGHQGKVFNADRDIVRHPEYRRRLSDDYPHR